MEPHDVRATIARAQRRDREAFAALYDSTFRQVYAYIAARVAQPVEAEDLTEEVFISALKGVDSLRAQDELGLLAWLFQIARNKVADLYRGRYREAPTPLDEDVVLEDSDPSALDLLELRERRDLLVRALDDLTPEQRDVIICKYFLDYDNAQTAKLVGRNINAVNALQHRGLAALRRALRRAGMRS